MAEDEYAEIKNDHQKLVTQKEKKNQRLRKLRERQVIKNILSGMPVREKRQTRKNSRHFSDKYLKRRGVA